MREDMFPWPPASCEKKPSTRFARSSRSGAAVTEKRPAGGIELPGDSNEGHRMSKSSPRSKSDEIASKGLPYQMEVYFESYPTLDFDSLAQFVDDCEPDL